MRQTSLIVLYFLSICLGFDCTSKQQRDIEPVKELLSKYSNYSIKENFNGMASLMYPTAFEKYSKEEIINSLRNEYHNKDYDFQVERIVIDSISDIKKEKANKYVFIKSHTLANFTLKSYDSIDSSKFKEMFDSHCAGFKKIFGESNVNCVYNEKKYEVTSYESLFAIYAATYKKWLLLS